jgi:hypothetical protein
MLDIGGSEAWRLKPAIARSCRFVVFTQNRKSREHRSGKARHRAGFLVAKITDIVDSRETVGRYCIEFREFASIDRPEMWPKLRNPVHYTTMSELRIDPDQLQFEADPDANADMPTIRRGWGDAEFRRSNGFAIPEAKRGLAIYYGVEPSAIEITIRA